MQDISSRGNTYHVVLILHVYKFTKKPINSPLAFSLLSLNGCFQLCNFMIGLFHVRRYHVLLRVECVFSKLSPGGLCHVTVYMTCVMVTG